LALVVPLSRFTPRVGGGSAFFVRRMKTLAEFEVAVSKYVAEQKRFFRFFMGCVVSVILWFIGLRFLVPPHSLSASQVVLFVAVVPLAFFAAIIFRAFKLDATAESVGLRCPKCRRWLNRRISVEVIRKTGLCRHCRTVIVGRNAPNKSPEPTAVGAGSSASRFTVLCRRWLSFFR
jgi:hypothetical protein